MFSVVPALTDAAAQNSTRLVPQFQKADQDHIVTSTSPLRPPVSPITPVTTLAQLATSTTAYSTSPIKQPDLIDRPSPISISESDNPDAVALRAAISILQVQRNKSKRDLQTLQQLKDSALKEPELFVEELVTGKLKHAEDHTNPLQATFEGDSDEDEMDSTPTETSNFARVPSMQDVVRCPPVNWAKYHILGEPLDKIHEEQRRKPTSGETARNVHVVAAPYSPFQDKPVEQAHPMQTRRGSKKPG